MGWGGASERPRTYQGESQAWVADLRDVGLDLLDIAEKVIRCIRLLLVAAVEEPVHALDHGLAEENADEHDRLRQRWWVVGEGVRERRRACGGGWTLWLAAVVGSSGIGASP